MLGTPSRSTARTGLSFLSALLLFEQKCATANEVAKALILVVTKEPIREDSEVVWDIVRNERGQGQIAR